MLPRSAGILLHPTSLPSPYGIGDLGPNAIRWVQTLAQFGQSWWQILPLNPTGMGGSPYQCFSAFAGNIALLSPELLMRDGLLSANSIPNSDFAADRVDFAKVQPFKSQLVRLAWDRFRGGQGPAGLRHEFEQYSIDQAHWLSDYARFMAIREGLGGRALLDWPRDLLFREPTAVAAMESATAGEMAMHRFGQFLFDRQWQELRKHCHQFGVKLIGDAPIFVSADSADVWAHPELFLLDSERNLSVVAGVPPDYFSPTGQHWGNPHYDWEQMARDGYKWWCNRLRRLFTQCDLVRLDHFRGFAAAWHIPAGDRDATRGQWVAGPGYKLFASLTQELGPLPIIAEDLGLITPDVHALRQQLGYPGMRVLQFMLGEPSNPYWPHNYEPNTVAYTGTHDNDTTVGWFNKLNANDHATIARYMGRNAERIAWDYIRLAWSSVANLAIAPLQDVLELGTEARMNIPGVADGNWGWRFQPEHVRSGQFEQLAEFTILYNRRMTSKLDSL